MEKDILYGNIILIISLLVILGLIISVSFDEYIDKKRKKILFLIIFSLLTLIAQNYVEYQLIWYHSIPFLRKIVAILGYTVRPLIIVLFYYIIKPNQKSIIAWTLVLINFLIHLTALFSNICFTITKENKYFGGALNHTCLIVSVILLIQFLYLTAREFKEIKKKESLIPIFLITVIIISIIADVVFKYDTQVFDYVTIAIPLVTIFYYIWLHLKFVRSHEKGLIAEQRIQLMLSQIQPHFSYNSLSSISELCETNPKQAQKLTDDFANYLRFNFTALTDEKMATFEKQLKQVEFYLNIEKVRFQDRLNIVYDIKCKNFQLPNLTIQPLVENAVKHGVCKKDGGGTVWIRSYENETHYIIEIEDDGVGFNPNQPKQDGKSHVGITNVKSRLASCGDRIFISSEVGKGTKVSIITPKKLNEEVN